MCDKLTVLQFHHCVNTTDKIFWDFWNWSSLSLQWLQLNPWKQLPLLSKFRKVLVFATDRLRLLLVVSNNIMERISTEMEPNSLFLFNQKPLSCSRQIHQTPFSETVILPSSLQQSPTLVWSKAICARRFSHLTHWIMGLLCSLVDWLWGPIFPKRISLLPLRGCCRHNGWGYLLDHSHTKTCKHGAQNSCFGSARGFAAKNNIHHKCTCQIKLQTQKRAIYNHEEPVILFLGRI